MWWQLGLMTIWLINLCSMKRQVISPYILLYLASVIYAVKYRKKENERDWMRTGLACLMSLTIYIMNHKIWGMDIHWTLRVCIGLLMLAGGYYIWENILLGMDTRLELPKREILQPHIDRKLFVKISLCTFGGLFLWYLLQYPGLMNHDMQMQFMQLELGRFNNHHPYAHTMLLGFFKALAFSISPENYNLAIGMTNLFQVILFSLITGYGIACLDRLGIKGKLIQYGLPVLIYCNPVVLYQVIYPTKDTIYIIGMILLTIELVNWFAEESHSAIRYVLFMAALMTVILFRSTGLHTTLAVILLLILTGPRRNCHLLFLFTIGLGMGYLCTNSVKDTLGFDKVCVLNRDTGEQFERVILPDDTAEKLSIPLQQVCRIIKYHKEDLTQEQKGMLEKIIPLDRAAEVFKFGISDPVKRVLRYEGNQEYINDHPKECLKLWLKLCMAYPRDSIIAWLDMVNGYIVPGSGCGNIQFAIPKENNIYAIRQVHDKSRVYRAIRKVMKQSCEDPGSLMTLIASPCLSAWGLLLCLYKGIREKHKGMVLGVLMPLLSIAILFIATPVNNYVRYSLPSLMALYWMIPLLQFRKES